jgi:hypothetical protein
MLIKQKIRLFSILTILVALVIFYYRWLINLKHHVTLFFKVSPDSFLGILCLVFWGLFCVLSGFFLGYKLYNDLLSDYKGFNDFYSSNDSFINLMLGVFIVFFLFFSSSSSYFNNYIGLKLDKYYEDEYVLSGEDFLEYYEKDGVDVPYYITDEILGDLDNALVSKDNKEKLLKNINSYQKYYSYIGFTTEDFFFKETGLFQGYNFYKLDNGFLSYVKTLFLSFIETLCRTIIFFLIVIIPIIISLKLFGENKIKVFIVYLLIFCFASILLLITYSLVQEVFEWLKWFDSLF